MIMSVGCGTIDALWQGFPVKTQLLSGATSSNPQKNLLVVTVEERVTNVSCHLVWEKKKHQGETVYNLQYNIKGTF